MLTSFFRNGFTEPVRPKFDVSYSYDDAKHKICLKVKQTQKVGGQVGIFRVPVDVEVATVSGRGKTYPSLWRSGGSVELPETSAAGDGSVRKGGNVLKSARISQRKERMAVQLRTRRKLRIDWMPWLNSVKIKGGR